MTQTNRRPDSDTLSVVDLRTECLDSPLGVETRRPQLSWRIEANRRGVRQGAYRIEVASTAEALEAGRADLWDSGRVASDRSLGIRYSGAPLTSRQRCFWRVWVWEEEGEACSPSAISEWEMGLLEPTDWSARWLAAEDQILHDDHATGLSWIRGAAAQNATTQFRLVFSLTASSEATLFVASYGHVDCWMDGTPIPLPPAPTPLLGPSPTVQVTLPLETGRHVFAVSLDAARSLLQMAGLSSPEIGLFMRIRLADGRILRFNSNGWRTSTTKPAQWKTLDFDDFHWDEARRVTEPRPPLWPPQTAILMRRVFSTSKPVQRARVYATALGAYELYLNGQRVGDALLSPESTDFRRRALCRVYDVTSKIVPGENVWGALVGDGWYASYTVGVGRYPWGAPPQRLLAQLEMTYADGSRETVTSGQNWQVSRAPIRSSEIYDGEHYDARLEQPGWAARGFDASHWEPAHIGKALPVALTAHVAPPIREKQVLMARAITRPRPGIWVFDFGQNFAGWCRLKVNGPTGTVVHMRFAEVLAPTGEVDQSNLRSARATDTYILKGDPAGETFEPHFTYHGFRYVQVTGFPGTPTAANLAGIVVHSDLQLTGRLFIDHPVIQKLWHNTLWSQRSNFVGIPTDCPQRDERLGWTGDANVFWDAAAFNMDVAAFTRRFMGDLRDGQDRGGAFLDFNPSPFKLLRGEGTMAVLPHWGEAQMTNRVGASPGWADAGICLPWTVWQRYGDLGIIDENWEAMTHYLEFIHESNPDFIWRNDRGADYGDWLSLDAKTLGEATTPKDLIATALWAHSVACMAQMSQATARAEQAQRYHALWAAIASAFREHFIQPDGTVGNDSQTAYILALRYGLVPDAQRTAVAAKLVANIQARGTLLTTGFLGTPHSLDVLADAGYVELVYSLLLRTEFPSWGYMVVKGATTIWERWNGDTGDLSMNSFNHYALGAVCGFLFRRIAGIAPLEPGFRKIQVRPLLDPRVKRGGGEYNSVLGRISTAWEQRDAGEFSLDLTVPPNATALVSLPATRTMRVTERQRSLSNNRDVEEVQRTSREALIEVGSGHYQFAVC